MRKGVKKDSELLCRGDSVASSFAGEKKKPIRRPLFDVCLATSAYPTSLRHLGLRSGSHSTKRIHFGHLTQI